MQRVLANLLLEYAPLALLVENRVQWDVMPPRLPFPHVVMFVVSGVVEYTMQGASGYVATRIQFDCRGRDAAEARSVADSLSDRLSGFSGTFAGIRFLGCFAQGQRTRSDKDGPLEWFTDSRDFAIHWAPALI